MHRKDEHALYLCTTLHLALYLCTTLHLALHLCTTLHLALRLHLALYLCTTLHLALYQSPSSWQSQTHTHILLVQLGIPARFLSMLSGETVTTKTVGEEDLTWSRWPGWSYIPSWWSLSPAAGSASLAGGHWDWSWLSGRTHWQKMLSCLSWDDVTVRRHTRTTTDLHSPLTMLPEMNKTNHFQMLSNEWLSEGVYVVSMDINGQKYIM